MIVALFGTPSGGELLLVLLVVLLLFGAKNLPRMARTLGRTLEEFRRAAREVTDEIVHADDDESLQRPRPLGAGDSAQGEDPPRQQKKSTSSEDRDDSASSLKESS